MSGTLCWCGWGPVSTPSPSSSSRFGGSASAPSRALAAAAAPWVGRAESLWCKRELLCLEWLLQEAIGMKMTGYEVNRSWWEGAHSIPHFIDISELKKLQISKSNKTLLSALFISEYVDELEDRSCNISADSALMFCYFNSLQYFQKYLNSYQGNRHIHYL